jgi:hypothetical protein
MMEVVSPEIDLSNQVIGPNLNFYIIEIVQTKKNILELVVFRLTTVTERRGQWSKHGSKNVPR